MSLRFSYLLKDMYVLLMMASFISGKLSKMTSFDFKILCILGSAWQKSSTSGIFPLLLFYLVEGSSSYSLSLSSAKANCC